VLQTLEKHEVVQRDSFEEVLREMQFLRELKHLFICNLYYAFQDTHNLYMIMDLALGGDMRFRLKKSRGGFSLDEARFYGASLVLALEYLRAERCARVW
jgi:serine/threonine kinase 32